MGMDRVDALGASATQVSPIDPTMSSPEEEKPLGDLPVTRDVLEMFACGAALEELT